MFNLFKKPNTVNFRNENEEYFYCTSCEKNHYDSDEIEILYDNHWFYGTSSISVKCMKHKMWASRDIVTKLNNLFSKISARNKTSV